jgi:hypothetical protein
MSNIIQSLWIGDSLSTMEKLCLKSFADNGHTVHLYTYGNVTNVPKNIIIKDGSEIVQKDRIFTYKNGSYSAFSNYFRFQLLYQKGGYWVDADLLCTKPFILNEEIVIAGEPSRDYKTTNASSFMIKLPKGSIIAKRGVEIQEKHKELILSGEIQWGSGPATIKELIETFGLQKYVLQWKRTTTCFYEHFTTLVNPDVKEWNPHICGDAIVYFCDLPKENICIHLWNERWRRMKKHYGKDKNYDKKSIYEYFKNKHNVY